MTDRTDPDVDGAGKEGPRVQCREDDSDEGEDGRSEDDESEEEDGQ